MQPVTSPAVTTQRDELVLVSRLQLGEAAQSCGDANELAGARSSRPRPRSLGTLFCYSSATGDPEMRRDRYGLLPVSRGGCVDIYARPGELPVTLPFQVLATLAGAGGLWQVSISPAIFPGFYNVSQISSTDGATVYQLVSDVRGLSLPGLLFRLASKIFRMANIQRTRLLPYSFKTRRHCRMSHWVPRKTSPFI